MRFTLRQLEIFLAVAQTESVSRATGTLHLSQSAVSGALLELEHQFGVQLFDRVGKRLQLSELGRSVRGSAQALLDQAEAFERSLSGPSAAGHLRVGATLTIGNYLAVPLASRFMKQYPGAHVSLQVANTEEIARQVANYEIDVGLVEGELHHPELDINPWRQDQLVVFCSPSDRLARKRKLSDDDLLSAVWIVREPGSGTRQAFDRAMHGLLPQLNILRELQHTEAIVGAVAAGLGMGCLSQIALEMAFASGALQPCRVPHRDLRRQFYFVLHKKKFRSPTLKNWLALCLES